MYIFYNYNEKNKLCGILQGGEFHDDSDQVIGAVKEKCKWRSEETSSAYEVDKNKNDHDIISFPN